MPNPFIPEFRNHTVDDNGEWFDFGGAWFGAVGLVNIGLKDVWVAFDHVAVASNLTSGQFCLVAGGAPFNCARIKFKQIHMIAATGETSLCQAVATLAEQS